MAIKLSDLQYISCASRRRIVCPCRRHFTCHPRVYTRSCVMRHIYRLITQKNHTPFSSVRQRFQIHSRRHYALQGHYLEWDQHRADERGTPLSIEKCCVLYCGRVQPLQRLSYQIHYTAVQSEKGVSFSAIKNFHFEKNKKLYFDEFLKHYLRCIALNNMKFYTSIMSFIIYLMLLFLFVKSINSAFIN